jgi:RHS repeat-associated protein
MLKSVAHGNGVTVTHGLDPHGMRRPGSIATSGVTGTPGNWDSGAYAYDGAGNITRVGEEWYTYDLVSRLAANSYPMPEGECPTSLQSLAYTYDPLGNMTSWTYNCSGTHTYSVDPSTNRLTTQTYDPSGNALTTVGEANAETLAYYPFNDLRSAVGTGLNRLYGYTADGERLVDYDAQPNPPAGPFTITLRDLTGKVLRSFQVTTGQPGTWTEKEDWIYRDGQLLATVDTTVQGGVARHVHLDHLGTPRLITSASGVGLETHTYLPFGLEVTDLGPLFERMKFTGHERDLASGLDYMHARYYSPYANRFLSVDPLRGNPKTPQSWNLYAYARNNPVNTTDPTGEAAAEVANEAQRLCFVAEAYVDSLVGGDIFGVYAMTLVGTLADVASGTADLLRVGDSTGEAIGSGASSEDVAAAVAKDSGRAGGLVLLMAGGAQAGQRAVAARLESAAGPSATAPVGRLGSELSVAKGTNQPAVIGGRYFTGHALDQMQGRGIVPSVVDDTITRGAVTAGRGGATVHATEQLRVIVSSDGRVITVMPQ